MEIQPLKLSGLMLLTPHVYEDERGYFLESYRSSVLEAAGLNISWVQDNHAGSRKGTVRGLHFMQGEGQLKLVRCTRGAIWDVVVDIRPDSPTAGSWEAVELTEENRAMLYVPVGFAHGYAALSEFAECQYKCSTEYRPDRDAGILWNDPDIGIDWPVSDPVLSQKDRQAPRLREYFASIGKKWPA